MSENKTDEKELKTSEDVVNKDENVLIVVSSIDATVKKEKKKKEEAKNMYLEYFIRYVLNPIIKQRDISKHSRSVSSPTIQKELNDIKRKVAKKAKEQEKEEKLPEIVSEKKPTEKKREDDLEIDDIG